MAEAAGTGAIIDSGDLGFLFGEDQARYLLAVSQLDLAALVAAAKSAGAVVALVGQFGGTQMSLGGDAAPMTELSALYRGAFARAVG